MKPYVVISAAEAGSAAARTISFGILIDGRTIESRSLSPVESQEVREISGQYQSLFEKGCKAEQARDYFEILGKGLFHLFLENVWGQIKSRIDQGARFVISSQVPEVLGLPWELLSLPDGRVLGLDGRFDIRRLPKASALQAASPAAALPAASPAAQTAALPSFTGQVPPGPLRVLFMACEPLDYEQEERAFLQAIEGLDVSFEICDTNGFGELLRCSDSFRPYIVHVVGKGVVKDGQGRLSFQSEGRADPRSSSDLGVALARYGVQCIIFGGCQIESPFALDLLCQGVIDHVPLAIGWDASSDSSRALYLPLSQGQTIDAALAEARQNIRKACDSQDKICALPVFYSATDQAMLFDVQRREPTAHRLSEQQPLPGLTEGYAEDFVDRGRDLQRLASALREGTARTVVVTGPAGVGKSALATKLAFGLMQEGYALIPVYSSRYNPLSAARILDACISVLSSAGMADDARMLKNPGTSLGERLKDMLAVLEKGRFLLMLDDLSLDKETGRIMEPELAEFYVHLLRNIDRCRVIITSSSLPADAMTLPQRTWEWSLGGLPEAAFIKFLLKDGAIAERYSKGGINYARLQGLYASSAGLPSCLDQMRSALSKGVEDISLCDEFLATLYNSLTQDSCLAVSRASVYEMAMNSIGLAAVTGEPEYEIVGMAREWQEISLAYTAHGLWAIPSRVRTWLTARLSPEQLREAHSEAGIFLKDFAEAGRQAELGLSRLDCLMEARGHFLDAGAQDLALSATARISGYLERRGYHNEIIRLSEQLLQHEKHSLPMNWIARAYMNQGRYSGALEWYQRALEMGPDAIACHGLGAAYFRQGKYDLARESFQKALGICQTAGDAEGEAAALHSLAAIDMEQNRNDDAHEKLQKVLEIQERLGDIEGEASTLHDLATINLRQGDYDAARRRQIESLRLLERIGDVRGIASMLHNLASIDMEKGDWELAYGEFIRALELKRQLGDRSGEAIILHNMGSIDVQRGELDPAQKNFMKALEIYQDLNDRQGEAGAFFQLGAVAVQRNSIPAGLQLMALSNMILRSIGSEDIKKVEPIVERLAAQLNYSQEMFLEMIREITTGYRRDKGRGLVEAAFGRSG